jgi:hypothetical protein
LPRDDDNAMIMGGIQIPVFGFLRRHENVFGHDDLHECVDSVGHAASLVKLRADGCKSMGEAQFVCFYLPVEAGAIDSYGRPLGRLGEYRIVQMHHDRVNEHDASAWVKSSRAKTSLARAAFDSLLSLTPHGLYATPVVDIKTIRQL